MKRYRCVVCDHIYDPAEGDPAAGVAPGTAFDDIPDSWSCPECGATKADYEPIDLGRPSREAGGCRTPVDVTQAGAWVTSTGVRRFVL